jgi:hypothetical protein
MFGYGSVSYGGSISPSIKDIEVWLDKETTTTETWIDED